VNDNIKLLDSLIFSETRLVEAKRKLRKENELMIFLLQSKLMALDKEMVEHKRLIKKYRHHLESISKLTYTRTKLMSFK